MIITALFFSVILAIGIFSFFRVKTKEDYLVAGRRAGGLAVGSSLAATILGGSSTLGLAGLAFARGLTGAWWLLVGAAGLFLLFFFVPVLKKKQVYTLPNLIREWYGIRVQKVASFLILAAWMGIVGAQANAAGLVLTTFLGGAQWYWTGAAGIIFILYTTAGGQFSVIRTDLVQIILIITGVILAAVSGLTAAGGWQGLKQALEPQFFSFPLSTAFPLTELLLLFLVVGSTYLIGPDMFSRIFCSRNVQQARKGILLALIIIIPAAFLFTLLGMEARVLFPDITGEAAVPELIRTVLPAPLSMLMVVALLSAFISSADTTLLTMSAIISVDILRIESVRGLRLCTALAGIAGLLVGILSRGIIPSLLLGYAVFTGGLAVPIISALLGKPMRPAAALISIITGGSLALAGKLCASSGLVAASFLISLIIYSIDRLWQIKFNLEK